MNSPSQHTMLRTISNLFFVYSPFFSKLRAFKDRLFIPISVGCTFLHITPCCLSVIGLFIGLSSLVALFFSYHYFIILMSISLAFDFIDGSLARYKHEASNFGKYLDFVIDHVLMILMVFSLCHFLQSYYWLLGAGFFSIALYINVLTYSPVHIPSGRIALFIPCFFGFPQIGLLCLTLYGLIITVLMLSEFIACSLSMSRS